MLQDKELIFDALVQSLEQDEHLEVTSLVQSARGKLAASAAKKGWAKRTGDKEAEEKWSKEMATDRAALASLSSSLLTCHEITDEMREDVLFKAWVTFWDHFVAHTTNKLQDIVQEIKDSTAGILPNALNSIDMLKQVASEELCNAAASV